MVPSLPSAASEVTLYTELLLYYFINTYNTLFRYFKSFPVPLPI